MGPQQDRRAPMANGTAARKDADAGSGNNSSSSKEAAAAAAVVQYRECQRNHAASIGGHAVDGCREFMASGADGTAAALLCAACGCHRSFHRREVAAPEAGAGAGADDCDCSSSTTSSSSG